MYDYNLCGSLYRSQSLMVLQSGLGSPFGEQYTLCSSGRRLGSTILPPELLGFEGQGFQDDQEL